MSGLLDSEESGDGRRGRAGRRTLADRLRAAPRFVASIPVTLLAIGLLLLSGILTGTLFASVDPDDPAVVALEFGLPAFREGRVWTLFTGAVIFTDPGTYLLVGAILAVGLSMYERRVGSLRAAVALLVGHCAGIVIPALFLWLFAGSGWVWAATLSGELDAGLSAGGFGVAGAATALLLPPWRGRVRVLVTACITVLVLKSGLLWDLEHFTAWVTGLLLGPALARATLAARAARSARARTESPDAAGLPAGAETSSVSVPAGVAEPTALRPVTSPAETRVLTALIGAAFAVANVIEALFPGLGGIIGPGVGAPEVRGLGVIIVQLAICLLIAGALPQPRALPWWVATIGVAAIAMNSLLNTPRLPRIGDTVCALIVLTVLVWNRRAWPLRSDRDSLRGIWPLAAITVIFGAAISVALLTVRDQFRIPVDPWLLLREVGARFTFSTGPLLPATTAARAVLAVGAVIWALALLCWLFWALYLRAPGGWRGALRTAVRGNRG